MDRHQPDHHRHRGKPDQREQRRVHGHGGRDDHGVPDPERQHAEHDEPPADEVPRAEACRDGADDEAGRDAADRLEPADQPDRAAVGAEDRPARRPRRGRRRCPGHSWLAAPMPTRAPSPGTRTIVRQPSTQSAANRRTAWSRPVAAGRLGAGLAVVVRRRTPGGLDVPSRDRRHQRRGAEERDRVDRHDAREPEARDDEPAERRTEQAGEAAGEGREAVRLGELRGRDERRHQRRPARARRSGRGPTGRRPRGTRSTGGPGWSTARSGRSSSAWRMLATTRIRRRSQRSTSTPPNCPTTRPVTSSTTKTVDVVSAEPGELEHDDRAARSAASSRRGR